MLSPLREYRPKENVTHYYDNHTVSYYQMKTFIFDEELSAGPDTEKFTTINPVVFVSIDSFNSGGFFWHGSKVSLRMHSYTFYPLNLEFYG